MLLSVWNVKERRKKEKITKILLQENGSYGLNGHYKRGIKKKRKNEMNIIRGVRNDVTK
jgi:hypothetical protein